MFDDPYTGPYWSNGKFQPSVAYGDQDPETALGTNSRYHDTAFAIYKDSKTREAADLEYYNSNKNSDRASDRLIGIIPMTVNPLMEDPLGTIKSYIKYGPLGALGLLGAGVQYVYGKINKANDPEYLSKQKTIVKDIPKQDPYRKDKMLSNDPGPIRTGNLRKATVPTPPTNTQTNVPNATPARTEPAKVVVKGNDAQGPPASMLWPSKQAKRFALHQAKQNAAMLSTTTNRVAPNDWTPFGYQGRINAARKRKSNKVKPLGS